MIKIIGVRFRNVGKVYYFDPKSLDIKAGDHVIVETARGVEYGSVVLGPRAVSYTHLSASSKGVAGSSASNGFSSPRNKLSLLHSFFWNFLAL